MEQNTLAQAAELMKTTRDEVLAVLTKDYSMMALGFRAKFDGMISQMSFVAGTGLVGSSEGGYKKTPITSFMGEELSMVAPAKAVTAKDLDPAAQERKIFQEKVNRLRNGLTTLTNEEVLESYKGDSNVIRGVAKLSDVEDFKSGKINDKFIDQIRAAQLKQAADAAIVREENDAINNQR